MDIVERLRQKAHEMPLPPTRELREAADEIERLQEEHHDVRILNEQYYNENAILIAEIERLREALHTIGYGPPHEGEPLELLNQFVDLARFALQQKDSE